MKEVSLLDCTLRDGGFVNEWNFGHGTIVNLFERAVSAGIDYIEVGFLDEREPFDIDRTITPDSAGMDRIFAGLSHGSSKIFGMIDYGTCPLEALSEAEASVLDGIRVMVKKKTRFEALEFCAELKKKGYMVFVQPVSITGYSDEELLDLVERVNALNPFAMSIVDTYGLLDRSNLMHYFTLIDERLNPEILLGYHAHNNFQLAYSNSIALVEYDTKRHLLIDGSAYGMGKSAGNCPLELLTMYADENLGKKYDTSQILEMIDTGILKIYEQSPWGYQMQYFLCASNDCHPKYPQYLLKKKTLSVRGVNEILKLIDEDKRLTYHEEYIEELYLEYQKNDINDTAARRELKEAFSGRELLLLGPGKSIAGSYKKIAAYIKETAPLTIAINFVPEGFPLDFLFLSNSKRYMQLSGSLPEDEGSFRVIATSNVTSAHGDFDFCLDYASLIDPSFEIPDNSLPMLLRLLKSLEVKKTVLAGFDGYTSERGKNYAFSGMEYEFIKDYAVRLNDYTKGVIGEMKKEMEIVFLTESAYE
ncbi:MAG: aldolase catalytic domain-containing protein [Lachnospiraceae bacterium]|nr:aldolase catalytic domain-containing protein [Lachnospiraceae bacterium]